MRVLAILERYPQLSETYIATELRTLWPRHDISIIAMNGANLRQTEHFPYVIASDEAEAISLAQAIRPEVIHGHYLHQVERIHRMAETLGATYTIRTHSFDILGASTHSLQNWSQWVNDSRCLGVLAFPFLRERLCLNGMTSGKIHDCYPVVDFVRFFDTGPNSPGVMNVGAALPKKSMSDYLTLATRISGVPVRLFALGYGVAELHAYNDSLGRPATIVDPVQHSDMPRAYKQHSWLVYTASRSIGTVGWPMAIAEAQAAGVGVCIERIRDDIGNYVGEGGFVLDRLEDALEIIAQPVPAAVREAGFEQARLSDVKMHIGTLEQLWQQR